MQCLQFWRERALNSVRGGEFCTVKTVVIFLHSTCKCAFQGLSAFVWSLCCLDYHAKPLFSVRADVKMLILILPPSRLFLIRLQLNCWSFCSDIWGLHSKAAAFFWVVCAESSLIPPCPLPPWPFSSELGLLETALLPEKGDDSIPLTPLKPVVGAAAPLMFLVWGQSL